MGCHLPTGFGCFHIRYQDNGCLQGASPVQELRVQELLPRRRLSFDALVAACAACDALLIVIPTLRGFSLPQPLFSSSPDSLGWIGLAQIHGFQVNSDRKVLALVEVRAAADLD